MTKAIEEYRTYGQRIEALIRPATFPLAVKIVRSAAEIPPEFKRPSRDLGLQNFVCQNFKIARTYGWSMALTAADTNCKLARAVYGWDVLTEEEREWAEAFSVGLRAAAPAQRACRARRSHTCARRCRRSSWRAPPPR